MSSYHLLNHAIQLNNQGVRIATVGTGQDKKAMLLLSKAISVLSVFEEAFDGASSSSSSSSQLVVHKKQSTNGEDEFITLVGPSDDDASISISDCNVYCASILLNIALIYHRNIRLKAKAKETYQRIIDIVSSSSSSSATSSEEEKETTANMVKLVATKNLNQMKQQIKVPQVKKAGTEQQQRLPKRNQQQLQQLEKSTFSLSAAKATAATTEEETTVSASNNDDSFRLDDVPDEVVDQPGEKRAVSLNMPEPPRLQLQRSNTFPKTRKPKRCVTFAPTPTTIVIV